MTTYENMKHESDGKQNHFNFVCQAMKGLFCFHFVCLTYVLWAGRLLGEMHCKRVVGVPDPGNYHLQKSI